MSHIKHTRVVAEDSELSATGAVKEMQPWQRSESDSLLARWQWMTFPIVLFVFTRIALLGFSYIGLTFVPEIWIAWGAQERELFQPYPAIDGLCRWDCFWFYWIAEGGYQEAVQTTFFPLYPALVRILYELTGIPLHFSLIIVSNVAGLAALLVVYRIFAMLASESAARWGLALLAAYPFAFFQAAGYSESLMILYSALAILFALRGQHIWAGVMLGFGVLARHLTILAGAGLLAAQIRQRGIQPKRFLLSPAILGLLIPWLFLGLYCLHQYTLFGDPLAFWHTRSGPPWGDRAWWGIWQIITNQDAGPYAGDVPVMRSYIPFALVPTVGAIALLTKKQWVELAVFAVILVAVGWAVGIVALGRYVGASWPAFLPLGVWLSKHPNLQGPVITMLAVFQGLFFFLFIHQFPIF